ncbi:MAG: LEA type 2 family protein [Rectinemataceae bacterium]
MSRTSRTTPKCLWALLLALILLSGCATQRTAAPLQESLVSANLSSLAAIGLDQYRLRLPLTLVLSNPGRVALEVESVDCSLSIPGGEGAAYSSRDGRELEPGSSVAIPIEIPVDLRSRAGADGSGAPSAAWRAQARIALATREGRILHLSASAEGTFPVVRDPKFSIRSIKIERDLLVTTNLRLGLEIQNPNAFPIELGSLVYDFYGEGRAWVEGGTDEASTVAAGASAERTLTFTMNFADMDRRLVDLVANLRVVRYRLKGEARIATGLDYLPAFVTRFDREGSCAVQR